MPSQEAPVLAIDVGTSLIKCGLISYDGSAKIVDCPIIPLTDANGRYEVDTEQWIKGITHCMYKLNSPTEISAVVITGNGPTIVPTGPAGTAISNAITWLDNRSGTEIQLLSEQTGRKRENSFFLSKIYWIYRNSNDLYKETRQFVSGPEYIELRLTDDWHTNLPNPVFQKYYWDSETLEELGINPQKLPKFIETGTPIRTTNTKSEEMLIPKNIPVFAGAPDFVMAVLGTGTTSPRITCNRSGSSEGINYCSTKPFDKFGLISLPHIIEGLFTVSGLISTSGKALEWFAKVMGSDYKLFENAAKADPKAEGILFLPYLAGERTPIWNNKARGVFTGLSLSHGKLDMARAVVESIGYTLRDCINLIENCGGKITSLRIAGARNNTKWLNQIKADITEKTIIVPQILDAELTGCAVLGHTKLGLFPNLEFAADKMVKLKDNYFPNSKYSEIYLSGFKHYKREQLHVIENLKAPIN